MQFLSSNQISLISYNLGKISPFYPPELAHCMCQNDFILKINTSHYGLWVYSFHLSCNAFFFIFSKTQQDTQKLVSCLSTDITETSIFLCFYRQYNFYYFL